MLIELLWFALALAGNKSMQARSGPLVGTIRWPQRFLEDEKYS